MQRPQPKPPWLRRKLAPAGSAGLVRASLEGSGLFTVCQEAQCPNRGECYGRGEATFLLLGPACTRRCTFCAVSKQKPSSPDPQEPDNAARAAAELGLEYVVLTMVTRDDLPDGGAAQVAATIQRLHQSLPGVGVEALISDLGGSAEALRTVLDAGPRVLNHNLETVPRLYGELRPQARYRRSLEVLERAAAAGMLAKSGLMLGLGETRDELLAVFDDLLATGCRMLTLGQYLAPSRQHHPVARYLPPEEFDSLRGEALARGFAAVASGPYVRSSYLAAQLWLQAAAA
ncbi:MAG: lipoyl synthase [Proteobacteria bacterium]|nr:lipoyl synthase [Pseudomonadota bacterium]MBU1452478.1 lipoyl synthase [Pseudomonadota bacterium]MBU2468286.1 lipoyl synthase [Pseudomonadota bacterium]MBU2518158.1 lipoyl synthase [Pseudomonadota bacterium]